MQVFNVLTKKTITRADAEPLILWHRVGLIKTTKGGNWYLQMFHQPDTDFYVVEHKPGEKELPAIQLGE